LLIYLDKREKEVLFKHFPSLGHFNYEKYVTIQKATAFFLFYSDKFHFPSNYAAL
jgi:hypothetical protein